MAARTVPDDNGEVVFQQLSEWSPNIGRAVSTGDAEQEWALADDFMVDSRSRNFNVGHDQLYSVRSMCL